MTCPHFKKFETHMCVSNDYSVIPSRKHAEEFCTKDSHWACPMIKRFSELAEAFSYGI